MDTQRIIRRADRAEGGITADERRGMEEHAALWTKRILRTDPIEPGKITPAIKALYAAAGLKEPRVIIVPSPLVMAVAGGLSSGVWELRRRERSATDNATHNATDIATDRATRIATDGAARNEWVGRLAKEFGDRDAALLLAHVRSWADAYQGGNMWGAWDCYLTAARDILGLRLKEHEKYAAWEQAAIHGGFRFMHPEFCLVSDFPEYVKQDEEHRPHCATGPSHRWRDGWELYFWHGVQVTKEIIEKRFTAKEVLAEKNVEVRRTMLEIMGVDRFFGELQGKVVHEDKDAHGLPCRLMELAVEGTTTGTLRAIQVTCPSTGRVYHHLVPSTTKTAAEARASMWGLRPSGAPVKNQGRHGDLLLTPIQSFDEEVPAFYPEWEQ